MTKNLPINAPIWLHQLLEKEARKQHRSKRALALAILEAWAKNNSKAKTT